MPPSEEFYHIVSLMASAKLDLIRRRQLANGAPAPRVAPRDAAADEASSAAERAESVSAK